MIIFGLMMVVYSSLFFGSCGADAHRSVLMGEKLIHTSAYLLCLIAVGEIYFGIRAFISDKAKAFIYMNYAIWLAFITFMSFFDNYQAQTSIIYGSILPAIITFQLYKNNRL
jgi:hypothetical protein